MWQQPRLREWLSSLDHISHGHPRAVGLLHLGLVDAHGAAWGKEEGATGGEGQQARDWRVLLRREAAVWRAADDCMMGQPGSLAPAVCRLHAAQRQAGHGVQAGGQVPPSQFPGSGAVPDVPDREKSSMTPDEWLRSSRGRAGSRQGEVGVGWG